MISPREYRFFKLSSYADVSCYLSWQWEEKRRGTFLCSLKNSVPNGSFLATSLVMMSMRKLNFTWWLLDITWCYLNGLGNILPVWVHIWEVINWHWIVVITQFYNFIRVYSWCTQSVQPNITHIHHYGIIQTFSPPWKSSLLHLFIPLPTSNLWWPLIFLLSPQFCFFQNVFQLESYHR